MQFQYPESDLGPKEVFVSETSLKVRSIFYTIQGEGPFAGKPAVFVRLAGCNRGSKVSCPFCDTDFLMASSEDMSFDKIESEIIRKGNNVGLVVITGGEPMMHSSLPGLVAQLQDSGLRVQIETNGDYLREGSLPGAVIVVSPKVSPSKGLYKPADLDSSLFKRADYLKFVVDSAEGNEYHNIPNYVGDFASLKGAGCVYVSPVNVYTRPVGKSEVASMWSDMYDRDKCAENHKYAAQLALDNGFSLSIQMHAFTGLE